uniref:Uncharacterized protein n=1 Tax=Arundo donax TaxID=35708 RepID=A0A0A9HPB4_ARUDO
MDFVLEVAYSIYVHFICLESFMLEVAYSIYVHFICLESFTLEKRIISRDWHGCAI